MNMASRIEILKPPNSHLNCWRPPSLMAQIAAWGAFASTVPSAIWRVLMIMGLLPGTSDLRAAHAEDQVYVWCLSLVQDRKSTRLNSSHVSISYAVFCLKKKNK